MTGPLVYSRADLVAALAPFRCRFVKTIRPRCEQWQTGWGEAFTLLAGDGGDYDEGQVRDFHRFAKSTMPPGWKP